MQQIPFPSQILNMQPIQNMMGHLYAIVTVFAFLIPLTIEATYPSNEKAIGVNVYNFCCSSKFYYFEEEVKKYFAYYSPLSLILIFLFYISGSYVNERR